MSNGVLQLEINWQNVGRRVRDLRGYYTKQSDLAAAIGGAQSTISAIERGQKEVGTTILLRLARPFGKSVDWPLCGDEHESNS